MIQRFILIVLVLSIMSCDEKLIEKPENLIAKEKMIDILTDMAILNAAKTANNDLLRKNDFDPTRFVFTKYQIDSVQFVESDKYYASLPNGEYADIFTAVESKLENEKNDLEAAKKISDSLRQEELNAQKPSIDIKQHKKVTDSLQ